MTILYDSRSLVERYLIKLIRNPTLLGTNLVTPLLFLLLFSQLLTKFGEFLPAASGGYLAYLTPGVIMLNAMIGAPQSAVSMVNDLNSGFLSKMLLTQANRSAILLGRLLTDMLIVVVQSVITILFAIVLGVKFSTGLPGILLILATVAFFEFALSGIFLAVGIRTRKNETISAVSGVVFFPLIFISSAMFPLSFFPTWAQTVSNYNPVSYASNVTRDLIGGGLTVGTLMSAYILIGVLAAATFAATLHQFRKVVS
ncbi:MAG TPA: ABC transporter permease [Candidatus Bathyarchaeia archaeon]|nr:ABC transporter permease [Candidatus Bathyarchaeia archaeon]